MSRLTLLAKLSPATSDVRTVSDPWGVGSLTIRRIGNPEYQAHRARLANSNPMSQVIREAGMRQALLARPPAPPADGASADEKQRYATILQEQEAAVAEKALDASIGRIDLASFDPTRWDAEGVAKHLLVDWHQTQENENGEKVPMPFSTEEAVKLCSERTLIPEGSGLYGEGQFIGAALCGYIVEQAEALEQAIASLLRDQLGNSVASSGGS